MSIIHVRESSAFAPQMVLLIFAVHNSLPAMLKLGLLCKCVLASTSLHCYLYINVSVALPYLEFSLLFHSLKKLTCSSS